MEETPETSMDVSVDWPNKNRSLGSVITYSCPFFKATTEHSLKGSLTRQFNGSIEKTD